MKTNITYRRDEELHDTFVNGSFDIQRDIYDYLLDVTIKLPSLGPLMLSSRHYDFQLARFSIVGTKILGKIKKVDEAIFLQKQSHEQQQL